MIQKGHFVLADISGYTAFLTQLELEHSLEILDHLLKILVEQFKAPFIISKLEGDAIFAYAPEGSFMRGQTLTEAVEQIYFAFRLARDNLHRTCPCQACTLASKLDLKLLVHYGEYCRFSNVEMIDLKWGRLGVATGRYCVHANGKAVTVDTILDYQPFQYTTMESVAPNQMVMRYTTEIAATDGGVRVSMRASVPSGKNPFQTLIMRIMKPIIKRQMTQEISS